MSKPVRLPLNNRDVSRFFNKSVYNRSIKLWVNNTCFTCSRLILAQHSSIFEQHLSDSPPSVLLEDFHNVDGAENGIQDAFILLYGGAVTISMKNIQVLSKFALIYDIKELLKVSMEWINANLCVENVMLFFKALQTVDREGVVEVPEVIRKFMEDKTGPIVDHLLSSSDNIDDAFLLAMLELPSSSILIQRCLKAGMLPDPIVELIFKHSSTININFLLHDDKRTYVRLITILKSKARSYKDMEKIIDIQQKCITKMCHPYGSYDSIAIGTLTPAPSIATMGPPPSQRAAQSNSFPRAQRSRREEYHPKSLERENAAAQGRQQQNTADESEYMIPEELKHRQNSRFTQDYNRDERPSNHVQSNFKSNERPPFHSRDSSQDTEVLAPDYQVFNHDRNRDDPVEKSFTSHRQDNNDRMPASVVAQLKQNLEKNFVAKYPDHGVKPHGAPFQQGYDDNRDDYGSDTETYLEDHTKRNQLSSGMKSLSLGRGHSLPPSSAPEENRHTTKYAQVYMKKSQLHAAEDNKIMEKMSALAQHQTHNVTTQQNEMMEALNKLAEQQAIIEHTYDNMSMLSGRPGHNSPGRDSSAANRPVNSHLQAPASRPRAGSSTSKRTALVADSVTDFDEDIPAARASGGSRHTSNSGNSLRAPIHIPTTFGTTGSARNSVRSSRDRPPDLPSNPPPGSTSFFAGGASEAKSAPVARPPPTLHVPPPPTITEPPRINLELMSSIDTGFPPDLPPECLPDHDRMTSHLIRSPPPASVSSSSRPMSPPPVQTDEDDTRGRSRAPAWAAGRSNKIIIPNLNEQPPAPNLTKEELLQQSAVLLNKRSRSKSKERTKSKERKSMRKKKGHNAEKIKNIAIPMPYIDKDVKLLEHPTKGRPKKSKTHPPTTPISPEPAESSPPDRQPPYHIKYIPSKIPDRELYFSSFANSVYSDS